MAKILDRDDPILRQKAREVPVPDIASKRIQKIISEMKKALHSQADGVAIAAPQIGENLRIFVVNRRVVEGDEKPDLVFINPEVVKKSQKKSMVEEGCLSCRWLYGEVLRHEKISIKALNESGENIAASAAGLMAQIFQHEIDHLEGILFIDKAENLRDLPPEDNK